MTETMNNQNVSTNIKHIEKPEFIMYVVAIFFYTMMTGMIGSYRNAYFVNVLRLEAGQASLCNTLISITSFVINFFIAMYIDGRKINKQGKFRPLVVFATVPAGILLVLTFLTPKALSETLLLIYVVEIAFGWAIATNFCNSINLVANVMTPNLSERDNLISIRSISSAVGNSAPLVVVLVIGAFTKNEGTRYIICAVLCSVVGIISMLLGMRLVKERIVYSAEKKNPLEGFADIMKNKYAWTIVISDFLKTFRNIATYMGVFMAAALLGDTSKFVLFGLPTGIGTAVGMLIINFLLKKYNSKILYIASGIYSILINTAAFAIGYMYFKSGSGILQIVFIVFLFLIGLQFGASNLLPTMFQADVLESIELRTGKRLDASLPFVIGIGTLISGTIANALAPIILYGDNPIISVIHYIQPTDAVPDPVQSTQTKITMLFFYTIFHGIMMFLGGVPFFFYKLTGKTKEDIHNAVLAQRDRMKS
ncbi:MAG: MFS transporter, partial [Clostridiales bacterium]|nr:MFS transporter [Clostridiales bacterium]